MYHLVYVSCQCVLTFQLLGQCVSVLPISESDEVQLLSCCSVCFAPVL